MQVKKVIVKILVVVLSAVSCAPLAASLEVQVAHAAQFDFMPDANEGAVKTEFLAAARQGFGGTAAKAAGWFPGWNTEPRFFAVYDSDGKTLTEILPEFPKPGTSVSSVIINAAQFGGCDRAISAIQSYSSDKPVAPDPYTIACAYSYLYYYWANPSSSNLGFVQGRLESVADKIKEIISAFDNVSSGTSNELFSVTAGKVTFTEKGKQIWKDLHEKQIGKLDVSVQVMSRVARYLDRWRGSTGDRSNLPADRNRNLPLPGVSSSTYQMRQTLVGQYKELSGSQTSEKDRTIILPFIEEPVTFRPQSDGSLAKEFYGDSRRAYGTFGLDFFALATSGNRWNVHASTIGDGFRYSSHTDKGREYTSVEPAGHHFPPMKAAECWRGSHGCSKASFNYNIPVFSGLSWQNRQNSSFTPYIEAYEALTRTSLDRTIALSGSNVSLREAAKNSGLGTDVTVQQSGIVDVVPNADVNIDGTVTQNGRPACGNQSGWDIGRMIPYALCVIADLGRTWSANLVAGSTVFLSTTSGIPYTKDQKPGEKIEVGEGIGSFFASIAVMSGLSAEDLPKTLSGQLVSTISSLAINLVGLAVLLTFLVIGLASVMRIQVDQYTVKKLLPNAILGYLVAFLGVFAVRALIEFSDYVQRLIFSLTIHGQGSQIGLQQYVQVILGVNGEFAADALRPSSASNPGQSLLIPDTNNISFPMVFQQFIINGLMFFIAVLIFILAALFMLRNIIFVPLAALAPLAFFGLFFPMAKSIWDRWWKTAQGWAFMNVVAGFWLWLGFQFLVLSMDDTGIGNIAPTGGAQNIIGFIIAVYCIIQAMRTPFTMAGEAAKLMGKIEGGINKAGGTVAKVATREAETRFNRSLPGRAFVGAKNAMSRMDQKAEAELKATREGKSIKNLKKDAGKLERLEEINTRMERLEKEKAKHAKGSAEYNKIEGELKSLRREALGRRVFLKGTTKDQIRNTKREARRKADEEVGTKASELASEIGELRAQKGNFLENQDRRVTVFGKKVGIRGAAVKYRENRYRADDLATSTERSKAVKTLNFERTMSPEQLAKKYEAIRKKETLKSDAEDIVKDNQANTDIRIIEKYKNSTDAEEIATRKASIKSIRKDMTANGKNLEKEIKTSLDDSGIDFALKRKKINSADDKSKAENFIRAITAMNKMDWDEMKDAYQVFTEFQKQLAAMTPPDPKSGEWQTFLADVLRDKDSLNNFGGKGNTKRAILKNKFRKLCETTNYINDLTKLDDSIFGS